MLVENITIPYGHFSSGIAQYNTITTKSVNYEGNFVHRYRPTSIRVYNVSGDTVYIGLMNDSEYIAYQSDYTISDLHPVEDNSIQTFDNFEHEAITTVIASGVAGGSFDADLEINIIQD